MGTYLRQNIDSLSQSELIPFSKELEHTRVYADIALLDINMLGMNVQAIDSFLGEYLSSYPRARSTEGYLVRAKEQGYRASSLPNHR